jgi:glycosyltransferase involved in cell wall biosynthesis
MKIAACLIVKDSAERIEACLNSIRPFVDEIDIYDTGSTDDTGKILRRLNNKTVLKLKQGEQMPGHPDLVAEQDLEVPLAPIRVERGEWRKDFAWAREQNWEMVSDDVDWVVWLDDDDIIDGAKNFRALAATAPPELDGFVFVYEYAHDENGNCVCQLWRERLMRRSAGYTWQGAVHEVLVPPEGRPPGLQMIPTDQVRYIHNRPADRYEPDRNLEILLAERERVEDDGGQVEPRTLAYLGTEHLAKGRYADAIPYLQEYLERPDAGWSDERCQVAHKLALCLRMLGNPKAAIEVEFEALKERDDWAETHVGLCESFAALQDWPRAERWAKSALALGMPPSMLILNPLEFTFVPLVRLAEAYIGMSRYDEALAAIEQAGRICPQHPLLLERKLAYETAKYDYELVAHTIALREALIRHDENLKALFLMENVPYRITDNPLIVKARADTREMCKHFLQPEEYLRWYMDEPKESTLTDEHIDHVGEAFGRVGGLLEGLKDQEEKLGRKPKLLDLGCNDFWMGEFFWRQGFHTDGVELNRASYEKALERKERFGRDDAVIVHGDLHDARSLLDKPHGQRALGDTLPEPPLYDAVSLFEVLEHVPDIEKTLGVLESLIKPDGRVYISTPDGAFENGNLPAWNKVERKGHLRAIPMHELAEMLNSRGDVEQLEFTDGDRVGFASYTPRKKKGKIVFYAGGSWEPWSPVSISTTGLGGSETALVQVSHRLAREGYEVKVFSGADPGLTLGALWRPFTSWDPTEECDLLVVSRLPYVFDNPLGAKRTALWCHDHSYPGAMTEERAEKMDSVIVLSEWERDRFATLYPYLEDKLEVIRNGITVDDRYADSDRLFSERKPRCVFSSSADRGLDVMLEVWPEIREKVTDAELHVFYGFDVMDRVALQNPELSAYKMAILQRVEQLGGEDAGIHLRGRIGQRDLVTEMQEARVWSYPTAFLETSCIGAMEARASGLALVTSDLGALHETVGDHGNLIAWAEDETEPHNQSDEYKAEFVERVADLLTSEKAWNAWHERAREGVDELDWDLRIPQWEALVTAEVAEPVLA